MTIERFDEYSERPAAPTLPSLPPELREKIDALDTACANVLLAFHDWPVYESGSANYERRYALDALARRVVESRAARATTPPETPAHER